MRIKRDPPSFGRDFEGIDDGAEGASRPPMDDEFLPNDAKNGRNAHFGLYLNGEIDSYWLTNDSDPMVASAEGVFPPAVPDECPGNEDEIDSVFPPIDDDWPQTEDDSDLDGRC